MDEFVVTATEMVVGEAIVAEVVLAGAVEGIAVAAIAAVEGVAVAAIAAVEGVAVMAIPAGEGTGGAVEMTEAGIAGGVVEGTGSAMETVMGYMGRVGGRVVACGLGVGGPN